MDRQPPAHDASSERAANSGEWPVGVCRCWAVRGAIARLIFLTPRRRSPRNHRKSAEKREVAWSVLSSVRTAPLRMERLLVSVRVLVLALVLEPLALLSSCGGETD